MRIYIILHKCRLFATSHQVLRRFVAVAENGGLTRAAAAMAGMAVTPWPKHAQTGSAYPWRKRLSADSSLTWSISFRRVRPILVRLLRRFRNLTNEVLLPRQARIIGRVSKGNSFGNSRGQRSMIVEALSTSERACS